MEDGITLGILIKVIGILIFLGLNMYMYLDNGFQLKPKNGVRITENQISFRLILIVVDLIVGAVLLGTLINLITENWNVVVLN